MPGSPRSTSSWTSSKSQLLSDPRRLAVEVPEPENERPDNDRGRDQQPRGALRRRGGRRSPMWPDQLVPRLGQDARERVEHDDPLKGLAYHDLLGIDDVDDRRRIEERL